MKYLFKVLGILIVILVSLNIVIHIFDKGHKVSYRVGNFKVTENLKTKSLYNMDDYYFKISHEKFSLNFQMPINYNKKERVISDIQYQKINDMHCIMPIFKGGKILTDIMCLNKASKEITYYHDLDETLQNKLSKMVSSLEKYNYNPKNYRDEASARKLSNTETIYDENIPENHYLALETYKGLTLFNSKEKNVKLFNNDIYTKPIKVFNDKYYIVANYNENYSFKNFYVVNIINGETNKIRSYDDISFDSTIQGVVDGDIYLFDTDAEKQYKISLKYENVEETASKDGIKYYNGTWQTMTLNEALDGKKFNKYTADVPAGYDKADCLGKENGYCYYYRKNETLGPKAYQVYRADVQNPKLVTYLFTTTDIDSVIYIDDYIYFINGSTIYYYKDTVKRILENTELEFNDDITFGVYIRK